MHTTLQYNAHSLSHSSSFTSITTESKRNRPATPARSGTTEGPHHARLQPQQWLAAARESTELFKKNGSPLPLIWILVEDNQIPANAVPFEHDRSGNPLFIARALIEGELHIGKAGPQLGGSALISYGGRDRPISKYEVLVCASQLRWGISEQPKSHCNYSQGTVVLTQQHSQFSEHLTCHRQQTQTLRVEDISRVIPDKVNNPREEGLKRLARIKTVILVDDSFSMEGTLWAQAREALGGVVDLANKYGSKGIDLFFLHQDGYEPNLKTKREVESIFDHTVPNGEDTPTAFKLEQIINHYLPFLEAKNSTHEPITVIVLTDGVATDHEDLPARIVEAAHRLENHKIGEEMFGIQFVQIGDDAEAADALNELDDGLAERYNIRDIVDATPFNSSQGAFDTEYMLKILLGSINKDLDNGLRAPQPLVPALATSLQGRQTEGLSRLADVKTVILVDDSFSMADGDRWTQARQALAEVADLVSTYGSKGIDLFFLHQTAFHSNVKTKREVEDIFDSVRPYGPDTPTAFKLREMINHYLPFLEAKHLKHEPIHIIVITDGVATDHQDLPARIVEAARRLDRHNIEQAKFGIQFVQIGDDPDAASALRLLDDQLAKEFRIKDIVDTTPFLPGQTFDAEYMLKILLGGIDKVLDNKWGVDNSPLISTPRAGPDRPVFPLNAAPYSSPTAFDSPGGRRAPAILPRASPELRR